MRESEEYLENNKFICCNNSRNLLDSDDAEYAIKLAYKEGYLEAVDECMSRLYGFTELDTHGIEEILNELKKNLFK